MTSRPANLFDTFFKNRKDKIVIWQRPNLPLWGWIVAEVGAWIFQSGYLHNGFKGIGTAMLFTWAYLEIRSGESYFRRGLGAVVMAGLIYSFFINKHSF